MIIHIGCCGWDYLDPEQFWGSDWKTKFTTKLQAYAALFPAVELNSSFYRIPQLKVAKKWRSDVCTGFEFTVKANRIITHTSRFGDRSIWGFQQMKKICKSLDAKILLLQTPSTWQATEANIKKFELFFKRIERDDLLLAWEPRANSWFQDPDIIKKVCKRFDLIHCVDPFRAEPQWFGKSKIAYFRLHGFGWPTMYFYDFSQKELKHLKQKIMALNVRHAYVMFNNSFCYENGMAFQKMFAC